jgi:histone deacetylase 1/2
MDYLRRHGQSKASLNGTDIATTSTRKPRIMYLDLDVHFGDAPAAAFKHPYRYSSPLTSSQKRQPKPQIMTVSVHHHSPGFFPSTTEADPTSPASPTPCTISIPLRRAASAPTYARIWRTCIEPLRTAFEPDYVVLLLGMDALAGDKLVDGAGNWSTQGEGGVAWCIERVLEWGCKMLILGGGGYHRANTARGWAIVTGTLVSSSLIF